MRSKLDEEGLGIASHQEASVKQRRLLADATKGRSRLESKERHKSGPSSLLSKTGSCYIE